MGASALDSAAASTMYSSLLPSTWQFLCDCAEPLSLRPPSLAATERAARRGRVGPLGFKIHEIKHAVGYPLEQSRPAVDVDVDAPVAVAARCMDGWDGRGENQTVDIFLCC